MHEILSELKKKKPSVEPRSGNTFLSHHSQPDWNIIAEFENGSSDDHKKIKQHVSNQLNSRLSNPSTAIC